jgi:hypothetical protein
MAYKVCIVEAGNDWAETVYEAGGTVKSVEDAIAFANQMGWRALADYPPEIENDGFEDATISVFVDPNRNEDGGAIIPVIE